MRIHLSYWQMDSTFWRRVFFWALVLLLVIASAAAEAAETHSYRQTSYRRSASGRTAETTASADAGSAKVRRRDVVCGPVQTSIAGKEDRVVTYRDVAKSSKVAGKTGAPAGAAPTAVSAVAESVQGPQRRPVGESSGRSREISEAEGASVDYQGVSLQEAVDDLRERFKLNIVVYWPALEQAGIRGDYEITLRLKGVSVRRILDSLVALVSSASVEEISYQIDQGVVEIGLKEQLKARQVVRVYYIADLVAPRSGPYGRMGGYGGGGYGGYGSAGQESLRRALSEYGSFGRTFRGERNLGQYDSYHTRFGRGGGFRYQFPGMRGLRYRSGTGLYIR